MLRAMFSLFGRTNPTGQQNNSDSSSTNSNVGNIGNAEIPPRDVEVNNNLLDIDDDTETATVTTANTNNNNNNNNNNNRQHRHVTLNIVRDSIISANTYRSYIGDLIQFLKWLLEQPLLMEEWLTDYGRSQLIIIFQRREDEGVRSHRTRIGTQLKDLLRESINKPIANIDAITPTAYMEFILQLPKNKDEDYWSPSSYGNKRSALSHLFRAHNRIGFLPEFKAELTNLMKGFTREIATNNHRDGGDNIADTIFNNKEGKEAMSVELYRKLLEWFLNFGTADGVFAHCYLIITWNLACRAGSTARIRFSDVSWSHSFDAFSITFSQTKTDQLGMEKRYPRFCYANPLSPLVCPVLAIGIYLTSCFNTSQSPDGRFFPGHGQSSRFSKIMMKTIDDNWDKVASLGYARKDLGTHSIRKGAVSYVSSLPGGPPDASICIRAGWTMGKIKDIYMRYISAGDQFVGRSLTLLSLLREDFGVSPPIFNNEEFDWIEQVRLLQFPMVGPVAGLGRMTRMCLASILFHHGWLSSYLVANHVFLVTSHVHRSAELRCHSTDTSITYPWNDQDEEHAFTGVPPQTALLQQVTAVREKQQSLITDFVREVKEMLEGLDGVRLSERNLQEVLNNFQRRFLEEIGNVHPVQPPLPDETMLNRPEAGRRYNVHFYNGGIHRLPKDWRFPRCGIFDIWRHWWIGDDIRHIPPLKELKAHEYTHLDKVPLSEEEKHGRTGPYKNLRRPSRKTLNDLRYIIKYTEDKIVEHNVFPAEITPANVAAMFRDVEDYFTSHERDAQTRWPTVVRLVRARVKAGFGHCRGEDLENLDVMVNDVDDVD
jgi:hypothetical protein